jgi:hypothetical protein
MVADKQTSDAGRVKKRIVRAMTVATALIAVFNCYSFWILVSTFASGLVLWAQILHLVAPIAAIVGVIMALWRPRQPVAAVINGAVILQFALFVMAPFVW